MKRWMLAGTMIALAGCAKDPDCDPAVEDCGTQVSPDTGENPSSEAPNTEDQTDPEPVFYDGQDVTFALNQPERWDPLSTSFTIYDGTVAGADVLVTAGATLTGTTDMSLTVSSLLEETTRGEWAQQYTGQQEAGWIDTELELSFPMNVTVAGLSLDLSDIISNAANLPEYEEQFPRQILDTLALVGDGDTHTFEANTYNWTWSSGMLTTDFGDTEVGIGITLDFNIDYETTFHVVSYQVEHPNTFNPIGSQHEETDTVDITELAGGLGLESDPLTFRGKATAELRNELVAKGDVVLSLKVGASTTFSTTITDVEFPLGDKG